MQEFIIEDPPSEIDFVYLDYRKREMGQAEQLIFDLVMLRKVSLRQCPTPGICVFRTQTY